MSDETVQTVPTMMWRIVCKGRVPTMIIHDCDGRPVVCGWEVVVLSMVRWGTELPSDADPHNWTSQELGFADEHRDPLVERWQESSYAYWLQLDAGCYWRDVKTLQPVSRSNASEVS